MKLSVIVIFYNNIRESKNTLFSLSKKFQTKTDDLEYEVIAIDSNSNQRIDPNSVKIYGDNYKYHFINSKNPTPIKALNYGIEISLYDNLLLLIDGAHILSPGILSKIVSISKIAENPFIFTHNLHLGNFLQNDNISNGYNQDKEDYLMESINWKTNGYSLFKISNFEQSKNQWFEYQNESNAFFISKSKLKQHGGFNDSYITRGGGFANLDIFKKLINDSEIQNFKLLGEATFHQFHNGTTTNSPRLEFSLKEMYDEYYSINQEEYLYTRNYPISYFGNFDEGNSNIIPESKINNLKKFVSKYVLPYKDSKGILNALVLDYPYNPELNILNALNNTDHSITINKLENLLSYFPNNIHYLKAISSFLFQNKQELRAIEYQEKICELNKYSINEIFILCKYYESIKNYKKHSELISTIIANPDWFKNISNGLEILNYVISTSNIDKSHASIKLIESKFDIHTKAIQQLSEIKSNKELDDYLNQLVDLNLNVEIKIVEKLITFKNFKLAFSRIQNLLITNSEIRKLHILNLRTSSHLGHIEEVIKSSTFVLESNSTNNEKEKALYFLLNSLFKVNKKNEALGYLKIFYNRKFPSSKRLTLIIGMVYQANNLHIRAIEELNKYLVVESVQKNKLNVLFRILISQKAKSLFNDQKLTLQKIFEIDPLFPRALMFVKKHGIKIKFAKRKIIFSHIQKTAGMSIRKALSTAAQRSQLTKEEIYIPGELSLPNSQNLVLLDENDVQKLKTRKIKILADHSSFLSQSVQEVISNAESAFKFTFIRNPIDRIVSHYYYFYYDKIFNYDNCSGIHLNQLPTEKLNKFLKDNSELHTKFFAGADWHPIEKSKIDYTGFQKAVSNSKLFDFIGVFEYMDVSLNILTSICPSIIELQKSDFQKSNPSRTQNIMKIDDNVMAAIKKYNYFDIVLYNKLLEEFKHKYSLLLS